MRLVLGFLCEQARPRVLATSIKKALPAGEIERVFCAAWLVDVHPGVGREPLRDALRQLPRANFFRIILATHFLARAYWSHSNLDSRITLVDAAEQTLKPLPLGFDKGKIKRMIEADVEGED